VDKFIDLTGQKFGYLTVLKYVGPNERGEGMWLVECERDGNQTTVRGASLRYGKTKSCGCYQKEAASANAKDLTGQTFGRLTVLRMLPERNKHRHILYLCKCSCDGKQVKVNGAYLRSGDTKSCGCLGSETTIARNTTHGLSHHELYPTWASMIARCYDQVCQQWRESPQAFFDYMLKNFGPRSKWTSIDRYPNSFGNFEPGNVRWARHIVRRGRMIDLTGQKFG
jgi:hypothetical protein